MVSVAAKSATAGEGEVWTGVLPVTGTLPKLWMVYQPEINLTVDGTKEFRGINVDPRDFYVPAGAKFGIFKPQVGDIIRMTGDGFATGTGAASAFAVAVDQAFKLTWASGAISGLSFAYLATTYISISDGSIGTQRVTAYDMECVAVA
ncbi:MAG: hypothetical protein WA061_02295 [Microgenomates group bacterium]